MENMENKKMIVERRHIGVISVDSGLIWIGDPCYIIHSDKKPKEIRESWEDFAEKISLKEPTTFNHDIGIPGLGICTPTPNGNGLYNVYGYYSNYGELVKIDIEFEGA